MNKNAPVYNLKAVIRETGLTSATIHAWERRYGLVTPRRSPGGHRLFSDEEINILKWLVAKKNEGISIGQAVKLWQSQAVKTKEQIKYPTIARTLPEPAEGTLDQLRKNWVTACLAFNEYPACSTSFLCLTEDYKWCICRHIISNITKVLVPCIYCILKARFY